MRYQNATSSGFEHLSCTHGFFVKRGKKIFFRNKKTCSKYARSRVLVPHITVYQNYNKVYSGFFLSKYALHPTSTPSTVVTCP